MPPPPPPPPSWHMNRNRLMYLVTGLFLIHVGPNLNEEYITTLIMFNEMAGEWRHYNSERNLFFYLSVSIYMNVFHDPISPTLCLIHLSAYVIIMTIHQWLARFLPLGKWLDKLAILMSRGGSISVTAIMTCQ